MTKIDLSHPYDYIIKRTKNKERKVQDKSYFYIRQNRSILASNQIRISKKMTERDFLVINLLNHSMTAFYMSPFAKHGDSGYGRFLTKWIKPYLDKQPTEFKKDIHKILKGHYKNEEKILHYFMKIKNDFGTYITVLKSISGMDDLGRIKEAFKHIQEDLGVNCYLECNLAGLNEKLDSNTDAIVIKKNNTDALKDGCIEGDKLLPVYLLFKSDYEKSNNARLAFIWRGFSIVKISQENGYQIAYLSSSANDPLVGKFTNTPKKQIETCRPQPI